MVRTIRTISVERGYDPRDFVLMPFGGAGPLHARDVAVSLGMSEMVVPAAPGIVCAQGLLVSDLKEDFVASRRFGLDDEGIAILSSALDELQSRATQWFGDENAPHHDRRMELVVDARYVGQNFELAVPVAHGATLSSSDIPNAEQLHARFCEAHETAYGYASQTDPIEIVNVRLSASARLYREVSTPSVDADPGVAVPRDERPVYFDAEDAVATQVFARSELLPGQIITGPAIIEQLDTTTPVYPGDRAEVTPDGHLIIKINAETDA